MVLEDGEDPPRGAQRVGLGVGEAQGRGLRGCRRQGFRRGDLDVFGVVERDGLQVEPLVRKVGEEDRVFFVFFVSRDDAEGAAAVLVDALIGGKERQRGRERE